MRRSATIFEDSFRAEDVQHPEFGFTPAGKALWRRLLSIV
jgi:hypothetical protein